MSLTNPDPEWEVSVPDPEPESALKTAPPLEGGAEVWEDGAVGGADFWAAPSPPVLEGAPKNMFPKGQKGSK